MEVKTISISIDYLNFENDLNIVLIKTTST